MVDVEDLAEEQDGVAPGENQSEPAETGTGGSGGTPDPQEQEVIDPSTGNPVQENGPSGGVPASEETTEEDIRRGMEKSKFKELVRKGKNYREDYEFEMFGESVTIQLQPLADPVYRTLMEQIQQDVGEERFRELVAKQMNRQAEADEEGDAVDPGEMDPEDVEVGQTNALQMAAKLGIDPDSVGMTRAEVMETVDEMRGMKSIDIGSRVVELTDQVGEANEFPGSRGRD